MPGLFLAPEGEGGSDSFSCSVVASSKSDPEEDAGREPNALPTVVAGSEEGSDGEDASVNMKKAIPTRGACGVEAVCEVEASLVFGSSYGDFSSR